MMSNVVKCVQASRDWFWLWLIRMVPLYTEKDILARATEIQKKVVGSHVFFRDNYATIAENNFKIHTIARKVIQSLKNVLLTQFFLD